MKKEKFNSIDLFKLLMAYCVVAIHTSPLINCTQNNIFEFYDSFVTMAVPFFFIASGFFLSKKMECPMSSDGNLDIIQSYLKRILVLYLLWTVIYFPLAIFDFISRKVAPIEAIITYFRRFIFVGEQYNSWHLWYLLSIIYALIILIILFKKKKSIGTIFLISTVSFFLGIGITYLTRYYEGDLPQVFALIRKALRYLIGNGRILYGLFYITIGMIIAKKSIKKSIFWALLAGGFACNYFIIDPCISELLVGISSIGLFGTVMMIELKDSPVFLILRKMSTVIYFIHMYVWTFYYKIAYGEKTSGVDSFFVTVLISSIISIIYIHVKKLRTKSI